MHSNRNLILSRVGLVALFAVIFAILLAIRLYHVQIVDHAEYLSKAQKRYTAEKTTRGKRGGVYDCNGHMLVGNKPCETLIVDPALITTPEQAAAIADIICRELSVSREHVDRQINTKTRTRTNKDGSTRTVNIRYAVIARHVDTDIAKKIKQAVREIKPRVPLAAVYGEEDYLRYYPKGHLLTNVLGFTSFSQGEDVAVSGVESSFNRQMMPETGKVRYERARDGGQLPYGMREITQEEKDGFNIYLTIDEVLQSIVEEELDKMMAEYHPKGAYAIMADPKTGNILALAQRPTFNPNDRSVEAMRNKEAWRLLFIEDAFEPGSIMKALSISIALDEGVVTPESKFDAEGGTWFYRGKPLSDSSRRDVITVATAIQKSSNIVTAKIGLLMGEEMLYNGLKKFGIGEKTGIPLKPESRGIFPAISKWDGLSITRVPIGYSVAVTPMQMVRAYCALADNGNLRKLRLFDRAENPETGEWIENPLEPPVQIFKRPTTSQEMKTMLKAVTKEGGTARQAGIPGYDVAGKTGTSRKVVKGRYAPGKYYSSFIGFVPADDPAFVLMVTLDEPPSGRIYGGLIAGPTFRKIGERALSYLDIKPNPELMEKRK